MIVAGKKKRKVIVSQVVKIQSLSHQAQSSSCSYVVKVLVPIVGQSSDERNRIAYPLYVQHEVPQNPPDYLLAGLQFAQAI